MKHLTILTILFIAGLNSDPVMVTFLQSPPPKILKSIQQELDFFESKLKKMTERTAAYTSKKLLEAQIHDLHKIEGFLSLYKGYSTYSDANGRIVFPLRHTPVNTLFVTITPDINLIKINRHTFSNLEVTDNTKTYLYEFKQGMMNNQPYNYWNVSESELPQINDTTERSIIIISKPKNFFIKEGDFLIRDNGPNLVLPNNIYVIGRSNNAKAILNSLDKARYFDQLKFKTLDKNSIIVN